MRQQSTMMKLMPTSFGGSKDYSVKFGKVVSLEETVVLGQLYDFSAGQIKLRGKNFVRDFSLMDFAEGTLITDDIATLFDGHMDSLWVYSRILHDFKTAPAAPAKQLKPALMEFHFLAIERYGDDVEAFPFMCTDHNGQAKLIFSPFGPSQAIQRKISSDFWHILFGNPSSLFDYDQTATVGEQLIHFGRRSNQFYFEES